MRSAGLSAKARSWAIVSREGSAKATAGDGDDADLNFADIAFLPRSGEEGLWLLEAAAADGDELESVDEPSAGEGITIKLQQVLPVLDSVETESTTSFDVEGSPPRVLALSDDPSPFVASYSSSLKLCVTTSRANPWSTECAMTTDIHNQDGAFGALFEGRDEGPDEPASELP